MFACFKTFKNIASNGGGMSQFERDINMAIQQSLEEERKKQEALNQGQSTESNVTPGNIINNTPGTNVSVPSRKLIIF